MERNNNFPFGPREIKGLLRSERQRQDTNYDVIICVGIIGLAIGSAVYKVISGVSPSHAPSVTSYESRSQASVNMPAFVESKPSKPKKKIAAH